MIRAHVKLYTGREGTDCGWEPAIARLDGSTDHQWVSSDVLRRMTNPNIINLSPPETYRASPEVEEHKATQAVWITWHLYKQIFSFKGLFCIVEDAPFDMVIGSSILSGKYRNIFLERGNSFFHRMDSDGE